MFKKLVLIALSTVVLAGCSLEMPGQKKAGLQVSISGGEKASVFIDSINVGQTPFVADNLKPGQRAVKLVPEATDKASYETNVSFTSGNVTVITWTFGKTLDESGGEIFELSKASKGGKSELSIVTNPDNIIVKVDGQSKGFSPLILDDLSEGIHALTVTAPGYIERTSSPKIVKGQRLTVTNKLAREPISKEQTASDSATLTPTPSPTLKASPKVTPKPTSSTSATNSGTIKASTTTPALPYVEIKETGTGWLRVRAGASASGTELAKLDVGAKVPYLNETTGGWHKVEYQTGKQGWVSSQYAVLHKE